MYSTTGKQKRLYLLIVSASIVSTMLCGTVDLVKADPGAGNSSQAKFSTSSWLQAFKPGTDWTRVELARDFYKEHKPSGMARKKIIELLGEPAISTEGSPRESDQTTSDMYLLSSKNKECLQIDYDFAGKVSRVTFGGPCQTGISFPVAGGSNAVLKPDTLDKFLSNGISHQRIAGIEKALGKPHLQRITKHLAGGQYWANYLYLWRLSPDGRKVFGVYGHKPLRDFNPADVANEQADGSYIQTVKSDVSITNPPDKSDDEILLPPSPSNAKR